MVTSAGVRHPVQLELTRVGRGAGNDVVVEGPDAATVSLRHFEIARTGTGHELRDVGSTNGTFLNGCRVDGAVPLGHSDVIRLGREGPEFTFVLDRGAASDLNQTVLVEPGPASAAPLPDPALNATYDTLVSDAVQRARTARRTGLHNQTLTIMRDAVDRALRRSGRKSRRIIASLVILLAVVSSAAAWKILVLHREKSSIDARLEGIEAELVKASSTGSNTEPLLSELDRYEREAQQLRHNLLYRIASREEDLVLREIRTLMAEFGAEVYSIPPDFADRIRHHLERYQGPDRALMKHALGAGGRDFQIAREILAEQQLPPDLAYIPVVEIALGKRDVSSAGAAGPWQFTAPTARAYGLRVDSQVDERLDLRKSTRASCRYLRDLILDFGAGSSVMLALAAYNSGPGKVKQAVKSVRDPIKQRNFWYLYRTRALPAETREYVPKVLAAMIIARNPRQFGFETAYQTARR